MDYFIEALKKYAEFTGRASRTQYWMFILFYLLIYIGFSVLDAFIGQEILSILYSLALLLPSISVATRRLHDTGRSGWWQLIVLIPIIGLIILIVFLVQDSHEDNEYGENPKVGKLG